MNLVILGPEGSGKTTQSRILATKLTLRHLEIGQLIKQQTKTSADKVMLIDHLSNHKGLLLPDGLVINILIDHLKAHGYHDIIFDGFPRNTNQYQSLLEVLHSKQSDLTCFIYLKLENTDAVQRILDRRVCSLCTKTYSVKLEPSREHCECSGKLIVRPDDTPQAISSKIANFSETTLPLIEQLKQHPHFFEIDASQSVSEISTQTLQYLSAKNLNTQSSKAPESSPTERTLFVITHSESDYNKKNLFTGITDVDLTPEGHAHADLIAEILKNEKIQLAVITKLKRTRQTLDHVLKYHSNVEVVTDNRLIERDYGDLVGLSKDQFKIDHPDLYPIYHRSYDVPPPGGESMKTVEERVMPALHEIIDRMKKEKINAIIVAHSNSIRPIRRYFEHLSIEEMMKLDHQREQIFTYAIQI